MPAWDNGHLVQGVPVLDQHLQDGMTRLVIGRRHAFLFLDGPTLVGATESCLIAGLFKVIHLDHVFVLHGREDRCFVDDRGQLGTAEHRSAAG